jgi:hypothetical protein
VIEGENSPRNEAMIDRIIVKGDDAQTLEKTTEVNMTIDAPTALAVVQVVYATENSRSLHKRCYSSFNNGKQRRKLTTDVNLGEIRLFSARTATHQTFLLRLRRLND